VGSNPRWPAINERNVVDAKHLTKHNMLTFFKQKFKYKDICTYDSDNFLWADVQKLARINDVTVQYINSTIDRNIYVLSNGTAFFITGCLVSKPKFSEKNDKKEAKAILFDPVLLDI
jgi:hypothetical protein